MKKLSLALCLLFVVAMLGCKREATWPADQANIASVEARTAMAQTGILSYGSGVYYFDFKGAEFGNALAKFTAEHPELKIQTATPYDVVGNTRGYFVVFIPIEDPKAPK